MKMKVILERGEQGGYVVKTLKREWIFSLSDNQAKKWFGLKRHIRRGKAFDVALSMACDMLSETPMEDDIIRVTVCDKCLTASCWQGSFMCDEAQNAGTVEKTVTELKKLKREHPSFWKLKV